MLSVISRYGNGAAFFILLLFAIAVTPVMAGNTVEQVTEVSSLTQPSDEADSGADDLSAMLPASSAVARFVAERHLTFVASAPLSLAALHHYSRAPPHL